MEAEGHILIVLHEPPDSDDDTRVGRFYWRDPDGKWMPKGLKHGDHALGELLAEYERVIDLLDDREQRAHSAEEYFGILRDLNPLVRAANNLHNTLQKAREAAPDDRELILMRDAAYAVARRVELLAADTRHGLDYRIAMRAEEQAEHSQQMATSAHRLNLLVAFFFPLATLAGIFGMNLHNPLEGMSRQVGPMFLVGVLLFGLMLGGLLTAFVTMPAPRKKRRGRRRNR